MCVFRPTSSLDKLGGLPLEKAIGDVTNVESVRRAMQGCDAVIHAAVHPRDAAPGEELIQINSKGTRHMAQAARKTGVQRLAHVNSVAAVGISADPGHPADEEFQFNLEHSGLAYQIPKRRTEGRIARGEPWDRLRGRRPRITRATRRCVSCFQYFDSSKARRTLGSAPRDFDAIVTDWLAFDRTGRASG